MHMESEVDIDLDEQDTGDATKTNTQFVHDLMEFSRYGALAHVFVLRALETYASRVAQADPEKLAKDMGASIAFISPQAWIGVAGEIRDKVSGWLWSNDSESQRQGQGG